MWHECSNIILEIPSKKGICFLACIVFSSIIISSDFQLKLFKRIPRGLQFHNEIYDNSSIFW